MGTWGAAIFADDIAALVRDQYRDGLADGAKPEAITREMIADWIGRSGPDPDPEETATFWLALALAQWETGWLAPRVKQKALAVIRRGDELERWGDGKLRAARQRALVALAKKLESPPPRARTIRKRPPLPQSLAREVVAPGGRASATCSSPIPRGPKESWWTQVIIEFRPRGEPVGGAGVFAAACDPREVTISWQDARTLVIRYAGDAMVHLPPGKDANQTRFDKQVIRILRRKR